MDPRMTDDELLNAWTGLTLPFDQWTHRAHVRVALTLLRRHGFDEALRRMRAGVQSYNAHHHVPEAPDSGYNETTTHAFFHLIAAVDAAYASAIPAPDGETFCDSHPQLMTRHVLRLFYSPQRRMDPRAKTQFVEPDLCPLPQDRVVDRQPRKPRSREDTKEAAKGMNHLKFLSGRLRDFVSSWFHFR
jgi:hypothetical protein